VPVPSILSGASPPSSSKRKRFHSFSSAAMVGSANKSKNKQLKQKVNFVDALHFLVYPNEITKNQMEGASNSPNIVPVASKSV
jgi:hypothetical protein